jgi:hypothetical protein
MIEAIAAITGKLVLSLVDVIIKSHTSSTHDQETMLFLSSIRLLRFPNLREIQLPGLRWPTTEYVTICCRLLFLFVNTGHLRYDIFTSYWPKCSEKLAKLNVTLTDKDGCYWRPRLQRIDYEVMP